MHHLRVDIARILALLAFILCVPTVQAQITLDAGEIEPLLGTVLEASISIQEEPEETDALLAILAADGENDTYDFSGIQFSETMTGTLAYRTPAPGIPGFDLEHFQQASVVMEMHFDDIEIDTSIVMWSYSMIEDDGLYALGVVMVMDDMNDDGRPDTLIMDFDPPSFSSPLSYTYGDSWTSEAPFGGDTQVDVTGFGTLITPDGRERQALRVEYVDEFFGFETRTIEFVVGSEDGLPGVSASIDVGVMGEIESVSFTEVTGVTTGVESENLPKRFVLKQNYPNPFNPETTIPYELAESGHVSIKVYDALGREIATLVDGVQSAGMHSVSFDAAGLSSGMYIYRMRASGGESSHVMSLLK